MDNERLLNVFRMNCFRGYRLKYTEEIERCLPIVYGRDTSGVIQYAGSGSREERILTNYEKEQIKA